MGAIKEKIHELAELAYQIMDSGVSDQELDEFMEMELQTQPGMGEFYHAHKDIILDMIPYMDKGFDQDELDESYVMPRLNEDSFDEGEFIEDDDKEYKKDVVYHGRSEMPEDLVDDFDTSRNPDEEAPQSYEDWLDDVYWRISTAYDHDIDEDYTRELFQAHEDELRDIFDSGADVDEAEQLITDYDQEENADLYGSYCENCGDEFVDGICPECGASQEEYGSVDETYMMESLSEGCNCGGKKRPTLLPNGKRPLLIRRPPVKKNLTEKFIEKSDPIHDMGIGVDPKREAKKFMKKTYGNMNTIGEIYLNDRKMEGPAYVVHGFFTNIIDGQKPQDAFFNSAENENYYGDDPETVEIRKRIADNIQKIHGITINPNDPRL